MSVCHLLTEMTYGVACRQTTIKNSSADVRTVTVTVDGKPVCTTATLQVVLDNNRT